ncbi:glycosyltransferase family 4 protein [Sphaerisporangium fuscum]|uniref:glycosyltransferase family 4 protein n=1 Tax=Sphaerisporangium fuscum TaxID=2835868 RepID=UPI001BDC006B|nr:glycosyltransferase family 4 protein [Sphaerisporangium fuscum]
MRILRVVYRLPPEPGGMERHVDRLTREQLGRGHDIVLAHRYGRAPDAARVLAPPPTLAGRLAALRSGTAALAVDVARALPGVRGLDLVHLHGDHREALSLGPAARRLGVPLVVTVHGALTTRRRWLLSWAFRLVDGFIALGDRPRDDLLAAGVPAEAISVMSSGLDLSRLDRFRGRAPVERGLVVGVGSLEKVKNHGLLIEALHQVRATCPWARLVIAGEGAERERLERLAGTGGAVEFAGRLTAGRVHALVARAHAFVLASRRLPTIGEGVPTAALEALALGTPVIVSSDASLGPAVADGGAYRVFRSGSRQELVAHLLAVLAMEPGHAETARRGRRAVDGLDWRQMTSRVEECYQAVTARSRRRAAPVTRAR